MQEVMWPAQQKSRKRHKDGDWTGAMAGLSHFSKKLRLLKCAEGTLSGLQKPDVALSSHLSAACPMQQLSQESPAQTPAELEQDFRKFPGASIQDRQLCNESSLEMSLVRLYRFKNM
ncbi:hypothetical protein E5288_WYG012868 [Bos mutus]|uniref:Uncharacterized protein n=1 Tax=Bos mutus TaxID=72004 RepID=A0A6B0QZL5_9CETA|nr:hypothetical protein [Bos mutus]